MLHRLYNAGLSKRLAKLEGDFAKPEGEVVSTEDLIYISSAVFTHVVKDYSNKIDSYTKSIQLSCTKPMCKLLKSSNLQMIL